MPLFLDACAFVKRYVNEGMSTERMREITGRFDDWSGLLVSSFVEPEVVSAIAGHTRGRMRRTITPRLLRKHRAMVKAFRRDLSTEAVGIVPLTIGLITEAANLLDLHPDYNISAADAVHLVDGRLRRAPPVRRVARVQLHLVLRGHRPEGDALQHRQKVLMTVTRPKTARSGTKNSLPAPPTRRLADSCE